MFTAMRNDLQSVYTVQMLAHISLYSVCGFSHCQFIC